MENNLLIIGGVQKSGTTLLFNLLSQHPQITGSKVKEINFFDTNTYNKGADWYLNNFNKITESNYLLEASPHYYRSKLAAIRIKQCCYDPKLIFVLRDPIDRAISNYWFNVGRGLEKSNIDESFFSVEGFEKYINKGFYFEYLRFYYDLFEKENIKVLFFEEIISGDFSFENIFDWLGIEYFNIQMGEKINETKIYQNKIILKTRYIYQKYFSKLMPRAIKRLLKKFNQFTDMSGYPNVNIENISILTDIFREDSRRLEKLIQREVPWLHDVKKNY